jgi:hypothetical protein
MAALRLRFPARDIARWASRYAFPSESAAERRIGAAARRRGYLTRKEFLAICRWKTPRSTPRCASNGSAVIKSVTRRAFAADDEELKITLLRRLSGVGWPTASVILHFCDRRRYPILDYRALWSLGVNRPPTYTFRFWLQYVTYVRNLSTRTGHDMRTIDLALWQYSKEHQRRTSSQGDLKRQSVASGPGDVTGRLRSRKLADGRIVPRRGTVERFGRRGS